MSNATSTPPGPGGPDAKRLIELLLEHGVALRQIAKDSGACVEDLQAVVSAAQPAAAKTAAKLARLCDHRATAYGPYLRDNAPAIGLLNELFGLGLTERQVARSVKVGAPHLAKILRGHQKASRPLSSRLADLYRERSLAAACRAAGVRNAPAHLNAACKSPHAPFEAEDRERLAAAVRDAVLCRFVADRHERVPLPPGIPAVVVQLDDDLHIIAFDRDQCRDAAGDPAAHEYEAVANWCLEKAEQGRRKAGERARGRGRPKKWG